MGYRSSGFYSSTCFHIIVYIRKFGGYNHICSIQRYPILVTSYYCLYQYRRPYRVHSKSSCRYSAGRYIGSMRVAEFHWLDCKSLFVHVDFVLGRFPPHHICSREAGQGSSVDTSMVSLTGLVVSVSDKCSSIVHSYLGR